MNICNMYDRTKEIDKLIKIFKNNKDFYIFYDEEKDDYFLRKNKKNYTGKYEKIENSIDSDFYSHNYNLPTYFHKESGFYENGKREGIFIYEFFDSNIKFEVNYKNGEKEGKYSIYRFSKRQNKIIRIYEEGIFSKNEKISVTQYYYNRKDELEIKTIDFKKFQEVLTFRDGTKIIKEMFRYTKYTSYDYKNQKYIDYPDIFINGDNDIKLQLKILKDDVNLNTNFGYNDNDLIPLPKYTEYFDKNEKIYKRDFYKIEKVINYWGAAFESVLEKTEYYFENSENIKTEEVNKRVYLDYDFDSKFIKILLKE